MQKIIEDIQGKRSDDFKSRDVHKTDEGHRKRASLRDREDPSKEDRRYQRRKSRRTRDYDNKLRETACQTTMLEDFKTFGQSDEKRLTETNKTCQPSEKTCRRQAKKTNLTNNETGSQEQTQGVNNKHLNAEVGISGNVIAPWMRPLPPLPEAVYQKSKSQAHVYQKVFETLKERMKAEKIENISDNPWTSLSKSLSKQIEERGSNEFSRYVDIDVISEDQSKPQIIQFNGDEISGSDKRLADHGDYDEDHIYESIDENSDYEDNNNLFNCRELFSNGGTPASVHLLPNLLSQRPFRLGRKFRHEDTYLEPVCHQEFQECKNTSEGNVGLTLHGQSTQLFSPDKSSDFNVCSLEASSNQTCTRQEISVDYPSTCCSEEYPNAQCASCISDFQYSRDYAGSPTWSSGSPQHETLPLKATYV